MKRFDDDEEFEPMLDRSPIWAVLIALVIASAMIWLMWRQI